MIATPVRLVCVLLLFDHCQRGAKPFVRGARRAGPTTPAPSLTASATTCAAAQSRWTASGR
jgi:hypothetical protein